MKNKWIFAILIGLGLCLFGFGSAKAGGWAVLTLDSWPGEVPVGEPFTIRYALRQHGQTFITFEDEWVVPAVTAVNKETGTRVRFDVNPTDKPGYYEAELLLPEAGSWDWSIYVGYGQYDMPALTVLAETAVAKTAAAQSPTIILPSTITYWLISAVGMVGIGAGLYLWFKRKVRYAPVLGLMGVALCLAGFLLLPARDVDTAVAQPLPQAQPSAELGQILFQAKGCVNCHQHEAVTPNYDGTKSNMGPNLTKRDVSAEFLKLWLADPAQLRPNTQMPNLELRDDEIASLTAFLLAEQQPAK